MSIFNWIQQQKMNATRLQLNIFPILKLRKHHILAVNSQIVLF